MQVWMRTIGTKMWTLHDRPFCFQNKCTDAVGGWILLKLWQWKLCRYCYRNHRPYLSPQFALINRCLEKISREKVDALLITPVWQSQVWFPRVLECLVDNPVLLPETQDIIMDMDNNRTSTTSCLVHIRQTLTSIGLSYCNPQQVMEKLHRISAYNSAWHRWSDWCHQ